MKPWQLQSIVLLSLAPSFFLGCSNNGVGSSPTIRVTAPPSSSVVGVATSATIQWTSSGVTDNTVAIDLYGDTGFVQTVTASAPNTGTYSWSVSPLVAGDSGYRVKVSGTTQSAVYGYSGFFTIINNTDAYEPDDSASQATILDTGGAIQTHRISPSDTDWFKFNATAGRTYCIQTHGTGNTYLYLYATNASTQLSYNNHSGANGNALIIWTCVSSGTYYLKVAWSPTNNYSYSVSRLSGADYSIDIRTGAAIIAISSPSSGIDSLSSGSSLSIIWSSSTNTGTTVAIYALRNDSLAYSIAASVNSNGSFSWTVPWSLPSSSAYRIKIVSNNDTSIHDQSDLFSIYKIPSVLAITTPTSSTQWNTGTAYSIYWTFSGNVGSYARLDLYDSASYVMNIAQSAYLQNQSISWTIPSTVTTSSAYRIKITSTLDTTIFGFSAPFAITKVPSSLTVTTPTAATHWNTGSSYSIYWTHTGSVGYYAKLELYDSTALVSTITSSYDVSYGSYAWTIPWSLATSSRYKIKITSATDTSISDFSDEFTITKTPSTLTVTTPSATTKWNSGSTYSVYWTYTGNPGTYVTLALYDSTQFIANFSGTFSVTSQSCSWTIPLTVATSTHYRLKIASVSDTTIYAFSAPFVITKVPSSLTLTTPSATTNWNTGTTYTLYWTYTGNPGTYASLALFDSTSLVTTITSTASATSGAYTWSIAPTIASGNYRVKIASIADTSISNYSSFFKITNVPASIAVTTPGASTVWSVSSSYYVYWSYSGSIGASVTLALYNDSTFVQTISSSASTSGGSYYWYIPSTLPGGTKYRIKISSTAYPSIAAFSDYFTILQVPSRLTITTPSTSSSWYTGSSYSIYWTYAGAPGSYVKLDLYDSSKFVQSISSSANLTSGSLTWLVPSTLPTSNQYQIKITSTSQDTVFNLSGFFSITNIPVGITVSVPSVGVSWAAGSTYSITWSSTGNFSGSYVAISLFDSTSLVSSIASSVYRSSNYYSWPISMTQGGGSKFRVRVASTTDTTIAGYSQYFTIVPATPSLTITTPNATTSWTVGYSYTMYWSYSGAPGQNIKLELYDTTALIQSISSGVYTTNGSLLWFVPTSLPSDNRYRIKITSATLDSVYGFSSNFQIVNPNITDSYEPDSTYSLATRITVGAAAQSHTLSTGDKDWFSFSAIAGVTYTIQTQGSTDTYLNLFSIDGITLIASNDDQSGNNTNAKIVWTCPANGTYYFDITGSYGAVGNYTVAVN